MFYTCMTSRKNASMAYKSKKQIIFDGKFLCTLNGRIINLEIILKNFLIKKLNGLFPKLIILPLQKCKFIIKIVKYN